MGHRSPNPRAARWMLLVASALLLSSAGPGVTAEAMFTAHMRIVPPLEVTSTVTGKAMTSPETETGVISEPDKGDFMAVFSVRGEPGTPVTGSLPLAGPDVLRLEGGLSRSGTAWLGNDGMLSELRVTPQPFTTSGSKANHYGSITFRIAYR